MTEPASSYTVFVDDNFHYMDESERYQQGVYETLEKAVSACKTIVDEFLRSSHEPGITSDKLLTKYLMFGEDPWISPGPPDAFRARDYARDRCSELCRAEDEAIKTRRIDAPLPELTELGPVIAAVLARPSLNAEQRQALELMRSRIDAIPGSFPDRSFMLMLERKQDQGEGFLRTTFIAELTPTAFRLQWDAWKYETRTSAPDMKCLAKLTISFYGSGLGDEREGNPNGVPEPMTQAASDETVKLIAYSQAGDRR